MNCKTAYYVGSLDIMVAVLWCRVFNPSLLQCKVVVFMKFYITFLVLKFIVADFCKELQTTPFSWLFNYVNT